MRMARTSADQKAAALVLLACGLLLFGTGCKKRTVQAAPPVVVNPEPAPAEPAETETKIQPVEPAEPAPTPAPAAAAPKPTPAKTMPAPKPAPPPEPEPAAPKPAAPQISPRMSPADQVEYQTKTNEAIAAAERNLQRAYGRKLNSAQADMVEKIRAFLAQAREAIRASDWVRARNLAEKAVVLSNELVASL